MRSREPPGGGASSKASAALDRGVRSALRRLPTLADRLMAIAAADEPCALKEDDLEELSTLLVRLRSYLEESAAGSAECAAVAASIIEDAAARTALLRLVAVVVRWPPPVRSSNPASGSGSGGSASTSGDRGSGREGTQAYVTVARHTCNLTAELLDAFAEFQQQQSSPARLDFVQKLLRMDTLQCLARQFAAAADSVGPLTTQQVQWAGYLTSLLGSMLCKLPKGSEAEQLLHADMLGELAAALRDSCVMEHLARYMLLLPQRAPASNEAVPLIRISSLHAYHYSAAAWGQTEAEGQANAANAALREVLSGHCARHDALAHGVAALCVADGGSSYGLPEDVLQAISGYSTKAASAGLEGVLQFPSSFPSALIAALAVVAPSPPVGARAAVLLLLRLARLAVASANLWEAHAQHQRAGLPPLPAAAHAGAVPVVVAREQVTGVAFASLRLAWRLLRELLDADPPAWAVEAGVECWRLVAAALGRNALCWASTDELQDWGGALLAWIVLLPYGVPFPAAAPSALAAVLAGGLLPCLERLLRRAGEEPDGPESAVVGALLREGHAWHLWAHLLEYGEPRQAAALVATLGKLLRPTSDTWAARTGMSPESRLLVIPLCAGLLSSAVSSAVWLLSAKGRQLARLLVYAVCDWLPALSNLALRAMAGRSAPNGDVLCALLVPLLGWLPLLTVHCGRRCPLADGDGGWRLLLLEEVRVVPLLGAALRQPPLPLANLRAVLARRCCAVAAAFPEEVLRAASSFAWPPEPLRALLPELRAQGCDAVADGTEALATLLEGRSANGGGSGDGSSGVEARERLLAVGAKTEGDTFELAARLVPPAEARALLLTCSYSGCTSLAGDSEADARMRWCRFCNSSCYCCGECQLSHWREGGHKEACPGGAKARPG
ncbi:hypothetical protein TSOC_011074 [Tetrabaena socialis]|uniref:phytol kinase n=1 Tax=Tetrabaena socialis TaxID=47790 RepID=A0A2J7ZRK2_9CHLO|nr:hypothetical protein TSOC_011074 [Tetrabaena socialis]|eukprot:PNH02902.1 hypothetical protein TSOC_011074 [Tetrabaena socialis]